VAAQPLTPTPGRRPTGDQADDEDGAEPKAEESHAHHADAGRGAPPASTTNATKATNALRTVISVPPTMAAKAMPPSVDSAASIPTAFAQWTKEGRSSECAGT